MGDFSYLLLVPTSVANIPIDWSRVPEASKEKVLQWAYDWNKRVARPLPVTIEDLAEMLDSSKFFGYFSPDVCTMLMDISEFGLEEKSSLGHMKAGPRFYMMYLEQAWFLLFTPGKRDCISGHSRDIIIKDSGDSDEDYMENEDDTEDDTEDEAEIDEADTEDEADALAKEAEENKQYEEEKNEDNQEIEEKLSDKKDGNEDDDDDDDYKPVQPGTAEAVALAQEFDVTLEKEVSQGMARMVNMTKNLGGWSAYNVQLPHWY